MTVEEAEKIFEVWQEYAEMGDKLRKIFITLPESFLPYPAKAIEEASNIMAEKFFNTGDKKMVDAIETMKAGCLWQHEDDEVALESMSKTLDFYLKNPELKKIKIEKLKEARDSWIEARRKKEIR